MSGPPASAEANLHLIGSGATVQALSPLSYARFRLDGRSIEVAAVADCWLAPDHRTFKVVDGEDRRYILRHDVLTGAWSLTFYDVSS